MSGVPAKFEFERRVLALGVFALVCFLLGPFLISLAMGAVLAALVYPLLHRLEKVRITPRWGALLLSLTILGVLVLPVGLLGVLGARTGLSQLKNLKESVPTDFSFLERLARYLPVPTEEITQSLTEMAHGLAVNAAQALGNFLTQLPSYGLGLGILLMATYFFLADARPISRWLREHSVLDAPSTEKLIRSFTGACRSVILAGVASGLGQTFIFTMTAWIVGRTQVATLGLALFFASFIPVVGASPITFGVALHEFLTGNRSAAIALLAAAIAASFVDNVIRPWVLKGGANLHPLLGFLGVFGGIHLMGFAGVFLGPILLVLAGALLEALATKRQN